MSVKQELDAMLKVANVFRFTVVCTRNYFFREHADTELWALPVWIPLNNQIQTQLSELTSPELEILKDLLAKVGLNQGKEIRIELDEHGLWFMTINYLPSDFDSDSDDDDDETNPKPEYEEPQVLKAMAAGR